MGYMQFLLKQFDYYLGKHHKELSKFTVKIRFSTSYGVDDRLPL